MTESNLPSLLERCHRRREERALCRQIAVSEEERVLKLNCRKLYRTMDYRSNNGSLDEDGYTQLDFRSQGTPRTPVSSKKVSDPFGSSGTCTDSLPCRTIAVILGILCLILLVIAAVLGTMAIWRPNSGNNKLEDEKSLPRYNDNSQQPTLLPLKQSTTPPRTLAIAGALSHSHSCPHGWIKHKKSCYLFMDTLDSWFLSKRKCSLQGANLLKIENADELVFIEEQVDLQKDHSFWIGLSRQGKGYPWLWEDGSGISPDLIDVKPTPTVPNASHNCVWIHQSVFYDRLCGEVSFSICEKRLLM